MDYVREGELECCIFADGRHVRAFFREGLKQSVLMADQRVSKFIGEIVKEGAFPTETAAKSWHLEEERCIGMTLEKKLYRLKPEVAYRFYSEPKQHDVWVIIGDGIFDDVCIEEWRPRPSEIRLTRGEVERFEQEDPTIATKHARTHEEKGTSKWDQARTALERKAREWWHESPVQDRLRIDQTARRMWSSLSVSGWEGLDLPKLDEKKIPIPAESTIRKYIAPVAPQELQCAGRPKARKI